MYKLKIWIRKFHKVIRCVIEIVWYRKNCYGAKHKKMDTPQLKLLLRYKDVIVRTVKAEPTRVFDATNSLHPNVLFTLKEASTKLSFLALNINASQDKRVTCNCYQKPTDSSTIFNYMSCAPMQ